MTWWHAYGALVPGLARTPAGDDADGWCMVILGDSPVPPDSPVVAAPYEWPRPDAATPTLPYLTSWDHPPSDTEKDAVTPPGYTTADEDDDMADQGDAATAALEANTADAIEANRRARAERHHIVVHRTEDGRVVESSMNLDAVVAIRDRVIRVNGVADVAGWLEAHGITRA